MSKTNHIIMFYNKYSIIDLKVVSKVRNIGTAHDGLMFSSIWPLSSGCPVKQNEVTLKKKKMLTSGPNNAVQDERRVSGRSWRLRPRLHSASTVTEKK